MISLIGNTIKIPQGDSGAVTFYFKEKNTDFPLILAKLHEGYDENIESAIRFSVKKAPDNSAELAMEIKNFMLPDNTRLNRENRDNEADKLFRRFNSSVIELLSKNENPKKEETLYAKEESPGAFSFWYLNPKNNKQEEYDYDDSSITVVFDREDTVKLPYRQYYYEMTYIEGYNLGKDDEKIMKSVSLQNPEPFIVTGALN